MNTRTFRPIFFIEIILLILYGCGKTPLAPPESVDGDALFTVAAKTFMAQVTQIENELTQVAVLTATGIAMQNPTNTLEPSTTLASTSTSIPTNTPFSTITPIPIPTSTRIPTPTGFNPTSPATGKYCNWAEFVQDITIPDNTKMAPGTAFTKIWRLKNIGACTWTTGYSLIFVNRDIMGGPTSVRLPHKVSPGDMIDLSVNLVAPDLPAAYQGNWMLMDDSGIRFGTGADARNVFWVKIQVGNVESNIIYDFVASYCHATWENENKELPCPGKESESSGFVIRLENPNLESRQENEPALETFPEKVNDGWIAGYYPPVLIRSGYHFLADIGCLAGYEKCDVKFLLKYQIGNEKIQTLGEWHEVYDGNITSLDINLKSFAKQEVKFIFVVEANGSFEEDAAFWLVPKIIDANAP